MTSREAVNMINVMQEMFFLVRISDPETHEVWNFNENGEFAPVDTCYRVWGKTCACEHCSTKKTCRERIISDKYEILNGEVYHVTSKPVEIEGRVFAFEIVMKLDESEDLKRREVLLEEKERFLQIITMLSADYESVYYVDLLTKKVMVTKKSADVEKCLGDRLYDGIDFSIALQSWLETRIKNRDIEFLRRFGNVEFIRTLLSDGDVYKHIYRVGTEENYHYDAMKIVKANQGDEVTAIVLGITDVDGEVRAKQEQDRLKAEQAAALAEAKNAAEAASRAKTSFLFNMSHDIRTPMNAIIGFNNMAVKHIDDRDKVLDYLGKVDVSSRHLLSIINDVLDMARIESGKVTIEEAACSITACANELNDIIFQTAKDSNIAVVTDFSGIRHDKVYMDKLRVNRVVMNVLSNAVKYTNAGGTIHFSLTEEECRGTSAGFKFTVADNGIGMSEEYVKHIFEAFTREKSATVSKIQGTGLGMAITKELVDIMGGTIDVKSKLGEGTTMEVRFEFRLADDINKAAAQPGEQKAADILCGKRILLVEDNELNREIAEEILLDEGCSIDTAEDGTVAVEKMRLAKPDDYDLVLMDIQMPVMDGYEAARQIRVMGTEMSRIPIIAMTANAFEEDRKAALEAGMDEHIAKPIDVEKLKALLAQFLC